MSIILNDLYFEKGYATGYFVGENSEPLVCKLEDGVFLQTGYTMLMFHGDPLMRRVNEIILCQCAFTGIKFYLVRYLSFTLLMDITVSTYITCNLPSISF